ncbi:hypothetical protein HHUSO_G35849 [Huso huso]|uniref:Uncharacterized protein n=1 Tax=Huso huso TaxID=61971 RepID=A0ABR0Y243_HUSHU
MDRLDDFRGDCPAVPAETQKASSRISPASMKRAGWRRVDSDTAVLAHTYLQKRKPGIEVNPGAMKTCFKTSV